MKNEKQFEAAKQMMCNWLFDEHELGKIPYKLEGAGEFDYNEMHYYIFKFKASLIGKWCVGVCGGFEGDGLDACGHIFSEKKAYNEATAQADCIAMIEMIMAYWKEQATMFSEQ